ncbi:MAG TPA: ABC transporter permease [Terracidiphilus sp.]|jgi:predicted permease
MEWLPQFFLRRRRYNELSESIREHLDEKIADLMDRGMTRDDAERTARREFGNVTRIEERSREVWQWPTLESTWADVRFALRQLRKSPGFTTIAILTLAIGIGGMTAVFSVVDGVLLRPLPFSNPGQLISLHEWIREDPHDFNVTAPDVLIFQRESKAFSGVGAYIGAGFDVTGAGAPFHAASERVTASLFPTLGIDPLLGRTFTQKEDDNAVPVTVISYSLWRERFQSDPEILGKTIDLDRRPYTIVGVMPRDFEFPLDAGRLSRRDLWVPMSFTSTEKNSEGENYDYGLVARLRPGVSAAQAQVDVDRVIAMIQPGYATISSGLHLRGYFRTLREETVRNARPLLSILLGAVALILLIACVNLANLLLVRAAGRKRELGIRLALGAARRIVLRQLLTESLLLSAIGGAVGVALAVVLVRLGAVALPDSLPRLNEISIRWPMFAAAFGLVTVTGVLCGMVPARAGSRTDILDSLRDGNQGAGQGRSQHRLQSALVAVEIGLAMLLLVASGLLLRSFAKMLETDRGFQSQHVITASFSLPVHDYPTQQKADEFYAELRRRLEALPGVTAVGFSTDIPIVGQNQGRLITAEGHVRSAGEGFLIASTYLVQGGYFQALHIPLIRGRFFEARDGRAGAQLVTIIGQSFAEQYFHGKDPIGMRMKVGDRFDSVMPAITVVGVVGDVKQGPLDQPTSNQMYEPVSQAAAALGPMAAMLGIVGNMNVVLRTTEDPAQLTPSLGRLVHQLDPLLVLSQPHTMDEIVTATQSSRRFNTVILTAFAAIALSLSLLGIYGVLAYAVAQRTREIAIRMALGASRKIVLLRTLRYALLLTAIGITGGLIASIGLTRFLKSLLYGVKPLDSATIVGAVLVLMACSTLAGLWPARRAASIDPMQTLRGE